MAAPMDSVSSLNHCSLPLPSVLRKSLTSNINVPVVFKTLAEIFPVMPWKTVDLTAKYGDIKLDFRIVSKAYKGISWEGEAEFVQATILHFISWQTEDLDTLNDDNPFKTFDKKEYWAYSSYNYMNLIFSENSEIVKDTTWSRLGFPEVTGRDSTFWLGSKGAYTPCHFDSYGCNLVLQVLGRKKWVLFPPSDTTWMYPTRIPYEESSVFSCVNILDPDLSLHPLFKGSHPHVVVLEPGDVLFVPSKWWHFVISLDTVTTSINTWIKLDSDCECRLEESIAKALMSSFISYYEPEGDNWLNPKEEEILPEENIQYVSSSLRDVKRIKSCSYKNKGFSCEKVLKTSKETDVGSEHYEDDVNVFAYDGISKVEYVPFCDWLDKTNQSECSTLLPPSDITLKKVIDCFVHPEVIAVISRLIRQT